MIAYNPDAINAPIDTCPPDCEAFGGNHSRVINQTKKIVATPRRAIIIAGPTGEKLARSNAGAIM